MEISQIGQSIRRRREELGLSQPELAKRAGVDGSMIYRIEVQERYPSLKLLLKVCDVLHLDVFLQPRDVLAN